jgi:hypothetical protein
VRLPVQKGRCASFSNDGGGGTSRERVELPDENTDMPTYEPGDFIKVEFADDATGVGEWMWVRVDRCDENERLVFGVLDSLPLNDYGNKLTVGSELAVSFAQIRDHRKPSQFQPTK